MTRRYIYEGCVAAVDYYAVSMSDETTITIALITAAAGLGGALLGAAGAVFADRSVVGRSE